MKGRIFYLQEKMLENLQYHWTVEELAVMIEMSIPHLQKLFKEESGLSPIAWLRDKRLEKARELLETTFWHVQQIGIEVNIPNDSHFTRDFKKKYGVTPTEYRKQYWTKLQAEKQSRQKS